MISEEEQLRRAVGWRAARRAGSSLTKLGDELGEFIENRVLPQQNKLRLIKEAWDQLLPAELNRHCRIIDISGGRLKASVDSPSYMYELQLLNRELLAELARACPRARIKEIKFTVG